jgi:hypothetical protein
MRFLDEHSYHLNHFHHVGRGEELGAICHLIYSHESSKTLKEPHGASARSPDATDYRTHGHMKSFAGLHRQQIRMHCGPQFSPGSELRKIAIKGE